MPSSRLPRVRGPAGVGARVHASRRPEQIQRLDEDIQRHLKISGASIHLILECGVVNLRRVGRLSCGRGVLGVVVKFIEDVGEDVRGPYFIDTVDELRFALWGKGCAYLGVSAHPQR